MSSPTSVYSTADSTDKSTSSTTKRRSGNREQSPNRSSSPTRKDNRRSAEQLQQAAESDGPSSGESNVTPSLIASAIFKFVTFQWGYFPKPLVRYFPTNAEISRGINSISHAGRAPATSNNPSRFTDRVPTHFFDGYPWVIQLIYQVWAVFAGTFALLFVALPAYIGLAAYCLVLSFFDKSRKPPRPDHPVPAFPPGFVRNQTARIRLQLVTTPVSDRRVFWWLQFYLTQFAFLIEFLPSFGEPFPYIDALNQAFGSQVSFGDGIAFTRHDDVLRLLQNPHIRKGKESLGWIASDSQSSFSKLLPTYLANCGEDGKKLQISRNMIRIWVNHFPNNIWKLNEYVSERKRGQTKLDVIREETFQQLDRILPPQNNELPSKGAVCQIVGELFFFLATNGQMTQKGKVALLNSVFNGTPFLPHWFNFLLAGNLFENLGRDGYYTIRDELARYADSEAMVKVFEYADHETIPRAEAIRNVASGMWFAGAIAPTNVAYEILERLYSDPERMVPLYDKNPINFIKECTRLSKSGAVPLINFLSNRDQVVNIDGKNVTILANTPLHASIVSANRDPAVFEKPDDFNPDRPNLDEILTWNALEKLVPKQGWKTGDNYDWKKYPATSSCPGTNCPDPHKADYEDYQPPRFCPGHDLSIQLFLFIAERFKPDIKAIEERKDLQMPEDKFIAYRNKLDLYTTEVLIATSGDQTVWNLNPPSAVDMKPGFDADIKVVRLNTNYELPSFDEDSPIENTLYKLSGLVLNWKHVGFVDLDDNWDSKEDAIEWRARVFNLPPANVDFNKIDPKDGLQGLTTDRSMTRLAFFGLACQHTRLVNPDTDPFPHKDAVYVNDASRLYEYGVREPYERYGAYAYFDKEYKIVGIYWLHAQKLVDPKVDSTDEWEHAKWVWKTSFFALVTIYDHLLVTHMIEANTLVTQTRLNLPVHHPLRQFLKPFTYHTISVNYSAATNLINDHGLVHRIWAFNYDEFLRVVNSLTTGYEFRPFPKSLTPEMRKLPDNIYPIVRDSDDFWKLVERYVSDFLNVQYGEYDESNEIKSQDEKKQLIQDEKKQQIQTQDGMLTRTEGYRGLPNDKYLIDFLNGLSSQLGIPVITTRARLIEVVTQLIFNGTGRHEHVGQVSDYMMDPTFVGFKLLKDNSMQSIQSYTQQCALVVLTGLKMPKLVDDWSHLITEPFESGYKRFKAGLAQLQIDIDRRNRTREWEFQSFNPKNIETSVSV